MTRSVTTSASAPRTGARLAVIGGGWAGIAAAVEGVKLGHEVTLFEMAPQLGGRARAVHAGGLVLDNGQHILIGAYTATLSLMREVGVAVEGAFVRTPLRIGDPDGFGLYLDPGHPLVAFTMAVLRRRGWNAGERVALLAAAAGWSARRFVCASSMTVAELTARVPAKVREQFIDPLCVAALNTPSTEASATVFLRVLKDALFSGPGSADLLLPRFPLSDLLPSPATRWLEESGVDIRLRHRVESLVRNRVSAQTSRSTAAERGWSIDNEFFDFVVLATTPPEASRLVSDIDASWSQSASALRYEPIVTVYLQANGTRLPEPMLALNSNAEFPAQFVFDRGQLGGPEGLLAFVISGAQAWVDLGTAATVEATMKQALAQLGAHVRGAIELVQNIHEKRATFRCTPSLSRPPMVIAPGLNAAGDYVVGPYPATLEGAVRSGLQSARQLG